MLHAAYAVEYFIQGLVQRKCNLHIVFFSEHENLCVPRNTSTPNKPKYLLARAAIIRHLQANLGKSNSSIKIHGFASVHGQDFLDFLEVSGVYFVMSHDGANQVLISNDSTIQDLSDEAKDDVEKKELSRRTSFRTMICFLISQGYNIALINGLEWQDTKVSILPSNLLVE